MTEKKPAITTAQVRAWLKKHPDFLVKNPQLVPGAFKADKPVQSGNVVSFEQYSLQRLRQETETLRTQLNELTERARQNSVLVEGTLLTVENLLGATSPSNLEVRLQESAMAYFKLQAAIRLNLQNDWGRRVRSGILKNKNVYYGEIDSGLAQELFDSDTASAVICLLPNGKPRGLVAFANEKSQLFDRKEHMDSLLVEHLATVIRARLTIGWGPTAPSR